MKEKKFYIINHANKEKIDDRIERFYNEKMNKLSRMLERSLERKEKLLKDRVKGYEQSDKRWFHKKEEIKSKVKEEEKSMVEVARDYRLKS
jgi:adenylosuccinate synthase